jgi:signal transduction histidine kinase
MIATVFLIADYAVLHRLSEMQEKTRTIVENMLTSVELASRMGRDVARERRLVILHIIKTDPAEMSAIEVQIADVQNDFREAGQAYESLSTLPGERTAWEKLGQSEKALRQPLSELLLTSRQNQDTQARNLLDTLEPSIQEIAEQVDALVQINRQGAEDQVRSLMQMQRSVERLQAVLSIIGTAVTLIIGWWAIRLVGEREAQLVENSTMLEARNRELDAFAGRVAHDLRNPLNTINMATLTLAHEVRSDDIAVPILRRGVKRMDALIQDLLVLSRLGTQTAETCNPAKVVEEIHEDISALLMREGGILRVDVVPAYVRSSQGLLRQVLWNLVDNAVKYRRPEVSVLVELLGSANKDSYELRVSDNGMGLSADEMTKVFEPLYRSPRSITQVPGTGLGLSIVKRVVEASGGTIAVESGIGKGTSFIISLPLVNDDASLEVSA